MQQNNRRRRGFSLIELLIVIAIILILSGIAIPTVLKQLMSARETAAIQEIKHLHEVETTYYSTFGRYASLAELGPPASGAAGPAAADLIPKSLADGKNGGYIYTVVGSPSGYTINANPESFGTSGHRTFYSDQTMVIRNNWSQEPANANSPEQGAQAAATTTTAK